jgi:hypothetical protein
MSVDIVHTEATLIIDHACARTGDRRNLTQGTSRKIPRSIVKALGLSRFQPLVEVGGLRSRFMRMPNHFEG